ARPARPAPPADDAAVSLRAGPGVRWGQPVRARWPVTWRVLSVSRPNQGLGSGSGASANRALCSLGMVRVGVTSRAPLHPALAAGHAAQRGHELRPRVLIAALTAPFRPLGTNPQGIAIRSHSRL